jgi:hypothetical protein
MSPRGRGDRASVLLLVPAGFLVMLVLSSIAIDQSLAFMRQRQASSAAVDIANDLATAALDEAAFRETGEFVLDPDRAASLGELLAAGSDVGPHLRSVTITVPAPDRVVVELEVGVEYIFAKAVPGAPTGATVRARATAVTVPG